MINKNTEFEAKTIMKLVTVIFIIFVIYTMLLSCSNNDDVINPCECNGQFFNYKTEEMFYQKTDCYRTPPTPDYIFVKCVDNPGY